jgi:hypothetical protein
MILTPPISEWCKTTTRGAEDVIEAVVLPDGEAIVPDDRLKVVGMATVGVLVVVDVKEVSIKSDPVTFASGRPSREGRRSSLKEMLPGVSRLLLRGSTSPSLEQR